MTGNLVSIFGGSYTPPAPQPVDPPETQLRNAMIEEGFTPPNSFIFDGEFHRFATDGKRKGDDGWYAVHADSMYAAGAFGTWKDQITHKWVAKSDKKYSDVDNMMIARRINDAKIKRDAILKKTQSATASAAKTIWDNCQEASEDHPYLVKKRVMPNGARITGDGRLVIPMFDQDGNIASLQFINHEGEKDFSHGGKASATKWAIGPETGDTIYIAEGFATAASIQSATDMPVFVAFSTGGLMPAAADAREQFGAAQDIVIVADNDDSGAGEKYARAACKTHNCRFVMPPRIASHGETGTDANDYELSGGDLHALLVVPPMDDWLVHADDFSSQPKPVKWLVKKWLQDGSFMMVHGPSGGGKTFIVLDWCMRIASEIDDWNGNKVKNGTVLYLAGEGHHGLRARIAAWKLHNNQSKLNMWVSKSGCDMNKEDGRMRVVESVRALGEVPSLIVVDTLHRFLDGNENDTQDARAMIIACGKLMDEFGCAVLLVHHTGVNEEAQHRARGSSAWRAAMDIEISVVPTDGGQRKITQKKVKDGEECEPVFVDLLPVELPGWLDEDGEQVSSVVPVIGDAPPPPPKKDSKLDSFKKLFEAAWWASGAEEVDGYPYVSRSAMIAHLVTSNGQSEASAKQNVKPSETQRLIGSLLVSEIILPEGHGWRVQDGVFSSALLMRKNG